jgi:hypothetical protein
VDVTLGLPLHLWSKEVLAEIANSIGKFIFVDEEAIFSLDQKMDRVLVEFQVVGDITEDIGIRWVTMLMFISWTIKASRSVVIFVNVRDISGTLVQVIWLYILD